MYNRCGNYTFSFIDDHQYKDISNNFIIQWTCLSFKDHTTEWVQMNVRVRNPKPRIFLLWCDSDTYCTTMQPAIKCSWIKLRCLCFLYSISITTISTWHQHNGGQWIFTRVEKSHLKLNTELPVTFISIGTAL